MLAICNCSLPDPGSGVTNSTSTVMSASISPAADQVAELALLLQRNNKVKKKRKKETKVEQNNMQTNKHNQANKMHVVDMPQSLFLFCQNKIKRQLTSL